MYPFQNARTIQIIPFKKLDYEYCQYITFIYCPPPPPPASGRSLTWMRYFLCECFSPVGIRGFTCAIFHCLYFWSNMYQKSPDIGPKLGHCWSNIYTALTSIVAICVFARCSWNRGCHGDAWGGTCHTRQPCPMGNIREEGWGAGG